MVSGAVSGKASRHQPPRDDDDPAVAVLDASRNGRVYVPRAGDKKSSSTTTTIARKEDRHGQRQVSRTCAICLSSYQVGEYISWASNPACPHVFHQTCIKDWLLASGRKYAQVQRRRQGTTVSADHPHEDDDDDDMLVINFPMTCPCCRQPFILPTATTETSSTISQPDDDVESPSSASQG